jgi:hypothetical protein
MIIRNCSPILGNYKLLLARRSLHCLAQQAPGGGVGFGIEFCEAGFQELVGAAGGVRPAEGEQSDRPDGLPFGRQQPRG